MTTPLNNKKGTTLVELMVCLVLLALFGTAAWPMPSPRPSGASWPMPTARSLS